MTYENLFLRFLLITLIVEVPIVFLIVRYKFKNFDNWNIILVSIVASTLTLPYFWFIFPTLISNRIIYIYLGESIIVLVEAFIYYRLFKINLRKALVVSFLANTASVMVGLIIK